VTGSPARGEGAENYFAPRAEQYAEFRPRYPAELHAWLARICDRNSVAWDCATGNGQAAIGLADHFDRVVATDPSAAMIANALPHPRITYVVARYESGLPDRAADLVTVAQALHWFNLAAFLTEARRVLVTGGVLAAWCYALCRIEPAIDTIVDHYYAVTLAPFWPPERRRRLPVVRAAARRVRAPAVSYLGIVDRGRFHAVRPDLVGYESMYRRDGRRPATRLRSDPPPGMGRADLPKTGAMADTFSYRPVSLSLVAGSPCGHCSRVPTRYP
jgi:ubiquinone/menaquinone biosynthesis C-methylase UbiE